MIRLLITLIIVLFAFASACDRSQKDSGRSLRELDESVKRLEENSGKWVLWRSLNTLDRGSITRFCNAL